MIAIIDYKAGNSESVCNALRALGQSFVHTSNSLDLERADKVIFPGQGRAGQVMDELNKSGFADIIKKLEKPFLGICIGMQVLMEFSDEDCVPCLGIIKGRVRKIPPGVKLPQVGWNKVSATQKAQQTPLLSGIPDSSYFYFVNSYYVDTLSDVIVAASKYGIEIPAILQWKNFYATQFHPEKSGEVGLKLLGNFCNI